ncbi:UDP-N-acetylmuramate dehydrogenase [Leucobacter chromiireducens]|uniref:UDP-N-acetylenolpyruvoylglucosamine reductase n=1 Tax=Leucobacter chromiireducens subsp. solipictus TaxID=398235 RepID=A0ABS1SK59_9MICO|nr:UDP-N-acetylmuramate dehydrogenase [Leucobacter chromiireducens]MBL3679668.1 UDP-N-acetylmuramate dehydrogenase [Leucobacter chromiireducens subsp. solipictus]
MRVGGPAHRILTAETRDELIARATELWRDGEPWLLLGGGSNTVVHDDGYPGPVLLVRSSGIERIDDPEVAPGHVRIRVAAGEDWDGLVATAVSRGWAGIEALSGIPGRVGAAPVQNIGAYGQELSDVLHSIEFLDAYAEEPRRLSAAELELGYRDSVIKQGREGVVLSIDLVLATAGGSSPQRGRHGAPSDADADADADVAAPVAPVRYGQLATALGVDPGTEIPIQVMRDAVLRLRAAKGMVLDPADHDTWSCGSFFTNPIVTERFANSLPEDAPRFPMGAVDQPDTVISLADVAAGAEIVAPRPAPERMVKLSAAWLIDHAGVSKGFRLPGSGAAVSSKHTLAITNRGGATAAQVAELARLIVQRVQQEFGVILVPEPNLYGLEL